MNLIQIVLINIIILSFPFLMYLFYTLYAQNTNKQIDKAMIDFAICSSLYLQIIFTNFHGYKEFLIFLNIPLLIAYLEKHNISIIFISFSIILCGYFKQNYLIITLFIEYGLIYILYFISHKNKKIFNHFSNVFIFTISIFIFINYLFNQIDLIYQVFAVAGFIFTTKLTLYVLKIGEDITKLHISIKELEKETQYRTSLFKITHEIKNPIAVCKSYLDMFDFDNNEHKKYIPIVKEEIQKVLFLLQDFACMNKIKIEHEILDITMLIEDIIEQFKPVLLANNIILHYAIIDDEIYIQGDYNRLNQVLINILKNAMEAKQENKKMELSITSLKKENNFMIEIKDTGSGFDMDEFEKIKEPFYTTKKNGTGLGVSLSYEIIEAHKGTITYNSKVGQGTTVTISLPMVQLD